MPNSPHNTQLRIGDLAAQLGLNPKTIRYYEELGLLPKPRRTPAGYRVYGAEDLDRLRFIGKAKAIRLTLEEIAGILHLRLDGRQPCAHVLALLDRKLVAVDARLRALADVREELVALREEVASTMGAEACVCGIIEQHGPVSQGVSALSRRRQAFVLSPVSPHRPAS